MFGRYSIRALLNRAISSRVDAQLTGRMKDLQSEVQASIDALRVHEAAERAHLSELVENLQRVVGDVSTSVADRLVVLEASELAEKGC